MLYKDRIIFLRNRLGITQKDIADFLSIDSKHYGNCEREYEIFPLKHLNSLCNYFNVSLDYIFNFTNISNYEKNNSEIVFVLSAQRFKEFRKENKLTQAKLAEVLNASPSVLVHHENKRHLIATPFLYTICKKYNISADYLLGKVDKPKYLDF